MPGIVQMVTPRSPLAFSFRSADIEAGGWRWTSHSPTGSGPEGSSPNERGSGRSSASHPLFSLRANLETGTIRNPAHGRRSFEERTMSDAADEKPGSYRVLARKY